MFLGIIFYVLCSSLQPCPADFARFKCFFLKFQRYALMSQLDSSRHAVQSCQLLLLLHAYWVQSFIVALHAHAVASMYKCFWSQTVLCWCMSEHCARGRDGVILPVSNRLARVTTRSGDFRRACFQLALITLCACTVSST